MRALCSWFISFISIFIFQLKSPAADWPQWGGADRNHISSEKGLVLDWPEGVPPEVWRSSIGIGFSSIAVSGGRAYTMGNQGNRDIIWCLDALTGQPVWKHAYDSELGAKFYEGGPGATPTVHENRVYTISKWGDVFCLDASTGEVIWNRDLRRDPGVQPNEWGFGGSALIYQDRVIFNAGSAGIALNTETGRTIWSTGLEPTGYASPMLFATEGREAVLIYAAQHLVSLDPLTGEEFWRRPWRTGHDNNNAPPVARGNKIFITSYDRGSALLEVKEGKPSVVYDTQSLNTHMAPPVLIEDHLYGFSGHYAREPEFRCVQFSTGEVKWSAKLAAGSVLAADGHLWIIDGTGQLLVAAPSPNSFKIIANAQVLGGRCWSPPALAHGLMYLRNARGDLVCLNLTSQPKP
jgi:outer membrane protein assembly factor BamB